MNKKEAILKVYNCIKKETAKKAISIELKKQKTQLIDSKVGGTPYLPVGAEIPVDDEGKQLTLLAQINCEELVGMEDYPQKGLLQFFILMDDCYGLDFEIRCRNIYRSNVRAGKCRGIWCKVWTDGICIWK